MLTFGSQVGQCLGPTDFHRESTPIGSLPTAFQAEVMAILWCTKLLLSKNMTRIRICSDSWAAIAALVKTITKLALAWEAM
jgi:hypothetical protein